MEMRRSVSELSPLSVDQRPMLPQVDFGRGKKNKNKK